jgi:hypothetical protein
LFRHAVAHHLAHLLRHLHASDVLHLLLLAHHVLHLPWLRCMLVQGLDHLLDHGVILPFISSILLHGLFWVVLMRLHLRCDSQKLVGVHSCHIIGKVGHFEVKVAI